MKRGIPFLLILTAASLATAATAIQPVGHAEPVSRGADTGLVATPATAPTDGLPRLLADTGLFVPGQGTRVRPENLPFSPQYPLWSDGAAKRRWIHLPTGTSIDASRPDAWTFPPGTRLWKEFGHVRPIETRMVERLADGSWRYAAYVWNAEGTEAVLAPAEGLALPVSEAPGGRYTIPGRDDCRACHEGAAVPVLGFGALQLSPDRDPLAPHAEPKRAEHVDLPWLVVRKLVRNLPRALLDAPPSIAAETPTERAALGYLHGNCGHCHNDAGPLAALDLVLAQEVANGANGSAKALRSIVGESSRYRPNGAQVKASAGAQGEFVGVRHSGFEKDVRRVVPGSQEASVLTLRMRSRDPNVQMPPLGTTLTDSDGLSLIERWIREDLQSPKEVKP